MSRSRRARSNSLSHGSMWAGALALTSALGGCQPASSSRATAALIPLAGCDDALAFVRQVAVARMSKAIDAQLADFDSGASCSGYGRGQEDGKGGAFNGAVSTPAAPSTTTQGSSHATTASTTNNQVAGVDEADFVKNDDKYIYLAQNGVFRIVDGWPASTAHQIAKVPLDGTPKKLFVDGDRALIYVSVPDVRTLDASKAGGSSSYYGGARDCTYGYDCSFAGDGTSTKLEIFDIADRANPTKVREVLLSGSLIAGRRIGHAVHTVVTDNLQVFPELLTSVDRDLCGYAESGGYSFAGITLSPPPTAIAAAHAAYEALRAKNIQLIMEKELGAILPTMSDTVSGDGALGTPSQRCEGIYRSQLLDGSTFTSVVSLDLSSTSAPTSASIISSPGAVYASDSSLYIAVSSQPGYGGAWYAGYDDVPQASSVHKFHVSDQVADTAYAGSGVVRGRVLNQFSMDESGGNLRVATSTGELPDPSTESQLTILAPSNGGLSQIGFLPHLAPAEDIRAVRFEGDRAFICTFKKTDPLFVFDLSNPTAPAVTGELQIPGFSTYFHMLDDEHLLSIGYDANDHDTFAFFDGVLLQIFDISDVTNPTLAQRYKIGTRGTSSDALTDHLAFNYFPSLKMLAVPMTICEGGGDGTFGDQMTFSGLMLFDIDAQAGIAEHGRVPYPLPANNNFSSDASCSNWWSDADSDVKRSLFMDRYVYAISAEALKVESIDALGTDLQSIGLDPPVSP